jgi:hypothetical protein
VPSIYRQDSRSDPYDSSMENLRKARARRKELGAYPRPWRSKEERLMVRRLVCWWWTCRDPNKPSARAWAKQLGVTHVWVLKLVRRFMTDPAEVRRLQAYGDPKREQLSRAREYTRQMREQGQLRGPFRRADKGLAGNRMKKAVLAHLAGQTYGATTREIAIAVHVWPHRILRLLRRYERLSLIRGRRRAWRLMVWEITPHGRAWLERRVARAA